jgi:hypothetical protein
MAGNVFFKDPQATLDFGFDWSQWLSSEDNETIKSYTINISPCGLDNPYTTSTPSGSVIVWLSSGSPSTRYLVSCLIETTGSRIDERTINIDVKNR